MSVSDQHFDIVIVGAGPAGCVLANRLTENGSQRVALIEAGPDYGADWTNWPPGLLDASSIHTDSHSWNLAHQLAEIANGLDLPRGRVMGGSSAINACMWIRASAIDYDEWSALGNNGWSFDQLLPYFRKAESDPLGGPLHGSGGMVPIYRVPEADWTTVDRAFIKAAQHLGFPSTEDLTGSREQTPGVDSPPRNVVDGRRINAALTYLNAARDRPNLTLLPDSLVDRVIIEDGQATGVFIDGGEAVRASEVILSAGAYLSPCILLRSGIGPAADLRDLDIAVLHDLPGVGQHLLDHPCISGSLEAVISPGSEPEATTFLPVHIFARSTQVESDIDLHVYQGQSYSDELGVWTFSMLASLQYARSKGSVRLASADPKDAPLIDHRYFSEPADLEALCDCMELVRNRRETSPLAEIVEPIPDKSLIWSTRDELRAKVRDQVGTTYHPSSTCRMGLAEDPTAVVDNQGRVYGIAGLRVVDASIFPTGPRGNLHFPVVAVAEKIAAGMG